MSSFVDLDFSSHIRFFCFGWYVVLAATLGGSLLWLQYAMKNSATFNERIVNFAGPQLESFRAFRSRVMERRHDGVVHVVPGHQCRRNQLL